jgi:hypothetical protein
MTLFRSRDHRYVPVAVAIVVLAAGVLTMWLPLMALGAIGLAGALYLLAQRRRDGVWVLFQGVTVQRQGQRQEHVAWEQIERVERPSSNGEPLTLQLKDGTAVRLPRVHKQGGLAGVVDRRAAETADRDRQAPVVDSQAQVAQPDAPTAVDPVAPAPDGTADGASIAAPEAAESAEPKAKSVRKRASKQVAPAKSTATPRRGASSNGNGSGNGKPDDGKPNAAQMMQGFQQG